MNKRFSELTVSRKLEMLQMSVEEVYNAGYEDGYDRELRTPKPHASYKSPNQRRAELIQQAREFVKKHECVKKGDSSPSAGNATARNHWYETVFHRKGNKITAVVYWLTFGEERQKESQHVGRSMCNPTDVFNEWIGKAIALARALEIEIPAEFLNAVQPNEKVPGMKVLVDENKAKMIKQIATEENYRPYQNECIPNSEYGKNSVIIDDTNAEYEVAS